MIIEFEVSSPQVYERKYRQPEWPGAASGITVGIGYDLGYKTKQQIRNDWAGLVSDDMVEIMAMCAGVKGEEARQLLPSVRHSIDIPYGPAVKCFQKDLESYEYQVNKLPNSQELSADCFGALTSLVYNRGASFNSSGDRYREMRNVKNYMATREFDRIPAEIKSMGRLWAGTSVHGLVDRRNREAALFAKGLSIQSVPTQETVEPVPYAGLFSTVLKWLSFSK